MQNMVYIKHHARFKRTSAESLETSFEKKIKKSFKKHLTKRKSVLY